MAVLWPGAIALLVVTVEWRRAGYDAWRECLISHDAHGGRERERERERRKSVELGIWFSEDLPQVRWGSQWI